MTTPQKRIAIFLPSLSGGGAERTLLKLAGGIASRGYGVDLVLARAQGPYLPDVPPSVQVVDLRSRRDALSLFGLMRYLRQTRPAALISALHTNIVAILAKNISRVATRVIVSERNTFSTRVESFLSDSRIRLLPNLVRYFYPSADGVVAVSRGVADDLVRRVGIPQDKVTVIYNPVITPELSEKTLRSLDHLWFEAGQPPVILSVGRLTAQKDFATLIRAFARVRESQNARLLVLGEGEERRALEAEVRELGLDQHICLPGFVNNPYPYMKRGSVFVLSSRYEGLPGVLIEALFCGTRLVATDCPSGPREILADGKYGQLVPVGDVDALAQAMIRALTGQTCPPSEEAWQPFQLEHVVDQYLHLALGN